MAQLLLKRLHIHHPTSPNTPAYSQAMGLKSPVSVALSTGRQKRRAVAVRRECLGSIWARMRQSVWVLTHLLNSRLICSTHCSTRSNWMPCCQGRKSGREKPSWRLSLRQIRTAVSVIENIRKSQGVWVIIQSRMNELQNIHNEYLKQDHPEEDEDDTNLEPQKGYTRQEEDANHELEEAIMVRVRESEGGRDSISEDLEKKLEHLLSRIGGQDEEEMVRMRMNELALSKILVYTHGKSQFRLAMAHHHMGRAYLDYKCYEQAIDHLTLALKKNSKLSDIGETKLYHSFILTTLSQCYYEINSYEDALEVLIRAQEIQNSYFNDSGEREKVHVETLLCMARCHLKLKHYAQAHQHVKAALEYSRTAKGAKSYQTAQLTFQQARIFAEEGDYAQAVQLTEQAIEVLVALQHPNKLELIDSYEQLAGYLDKNRQTDRQIEALFSKLELTAEIYDDVHKNTLKAKRSIATVLIKHDKSAEAIRLLEEILEGEEKVYGSNSVHVGKTLKMLGIVFMESGNDTSSAEHYLKKAQKVLQEQGNAKLVKQIKAKLNALKESKEKRMNAMIQQP